MKHVIDNVYRVTHFGMVNYYVIDTGAGLVLIDAGLNKASIDKLEKSLRVQNYALDDITHILITHAHSDHIGGLKDLQARINAPTYAHVLDAPIVRGEKVAPQPMRETLKGFSRLMTIPSKLGEPMRVDVELNDGDKLHDVFQGLEVVHLPGHSEGQVGFYLTESRVLIGGDVMMHMPLGLGLRMPFKAYTSDWQVAQDSVRKVAAMDVRVLCVGHGVPVLGDADRVVEKLVKRMT